jgi:N-methylhydantoinase A
VVLVGVDIGGTFTDLVCWVDGNLRSVKVPSTPDDYARGFLDALGRLGLPFSSIDEILHGTTVATNALLERKGARCGMVTTKGFRDVLELRQGTRRSAYGLEPRFDPLIPRALRYEIDEHTTPNGVERGVDPEAVRKIGFLLQDAEVEAVVIGLLHAMSDGSNEASVRDEIEAVWPEAVVICSSSVCDVPTEFERFSTAAASAYVTPMIRRYLQNLERELGAAGCRDTLRIVTSDGGTVTPDVAISAAVRTAVSGPAAGVSGARHLCALAGYTSFVTCDMGGTSFDACLVADGIPTLTRERTLAFGLPIAVEMLDIATIGAGGGSIVRPNEVGGVDVGPDGLGADPGPACYGKQSHRAAVTDADVVLGRLGGRLRLPEGERTLDVGAAERVIAERVATPLGVNVFQAAEAIVDRVDEMMAEELRTLSLEKRCPLDEAVLVAYGGAGPLHAAGIAADLGIRTVLVPPRAGLFSAWGGLLAERRETQSARVTIPLEEAALCDLRALIDQQTETVRMMLGDESDLLVEIDVAYQGQAACVALHLPCRFDVKLLRSQFEKRAGLAGLEDVPLEVRGVRTTAIKGSVRQIQSLLPIVAGGTGEPSEHRSVRFGEEDVSCPVFDRASLVVDTAVDGPAIVEEDGATTLVPGNATFRVDERGLLLVQLGGVT